MGITSKLRKRVWLGMHGYALLRLSMHIYDEMPFANRQLDTAILRLVIHLYQ